ncbi:MAG: hypothetical protein WBZ48_00460 [Bacteroidota bacterium]
MFKIITWTAVIAGIVALPFLIRKRQEQSDYRDVNVRYDIEDYISEISL